MRYWAAIFFLMSCLTAANAHAGEAVGKTSMDYKAYAEKSVEIESFRKERLLDIPSALKMAQEGAAILIDVRDASLFDKAHIKGAVNLSVANITEENLAAIIPSKDTPVILYCDEGIHATPTRMVAASAMAYPAFYVHGYHNLYELKPLWREKNIQEQHDLIPFTHKEGSTEH